MRCSTPGTRNVERPSSIRELVESETEHENRRPYGGEYAARFESVPLHAAHDLRNENVDRDAHDEEKEREDEVGEGPTVPFRVRERLVGVVPSSPGC